MSNLFTQEQILEIKQRLREMGSKDTEFPSASLPLSGKETIAIVQGGENKKVPLEEFYEEFSQYIDSSERVDFFNVSRYVQRINSYPEVARLTLTEAVAACPEDVQRAGQVITFMDNNEAWATWQFIGATNETWSDTNASWKNLDESERVDFTLTCDTSSVKAGQTAEVTLHFATGDAGDAGVVEVYANNILLRTYRNVSTFDFTTEVSEETTFKVKATQYGYTSEKTAKVLVAYTAYMGSGQLVADVMTDVHAIQISTMDGSYNITFSDAAYLFIVVPTSIVVGPVTMSGFEVPMQAPVTRTINEVAYNIYQSSNTYVAGTHTFVIGTYAGSDKETMLSMQEDIGGLQTLMNEQQETNNQQSGDISSMQSDIQELQESQGFTADNEDITTVQSKYKFADKTYDTQNFSGLGRVYLRKNLTNLSVTDGNVTVVTRVNLLTQSMINKTNTIYLIQYDYTLNGETIEIPEGSILQFMGGSISNGTVVGSNTVVTGIVGGFTATKTGTWNMLDIASIGSRLSALED